MKERVWKRYKLKLLACEALPGNKEMTEDKMVGWHHRLDRHEFEQAPADGKPGVLQCTGSQSVEHD